MKIYLRGFLMFLAFCFGVSSWGQEYQFKRVIGDFSFTKPTEISVDTKGFIYILSSDGYFAKMDSQGNPSLVIGTDATNLVTSGDTVTYDYTSGMAVDSQGNIYIIDNTSSRILKYSSAGKLIMAIGSKGSGDGQFARPSKGIAIDNQDNVFVLDRDNNNRIQKFDSDGRFLMKFGSSGEEDGQFYYLEDITVDRQGNIYVADLNSVQKFDTNGRFLKKISYGQNENSFYNASSVAVDAQGNIFIIDSSTSYGSNRIQKFNSNGDFLLKFNIASNNEYYSFEDITVDDQGYVFTVDQVNNLIQKFDSNGNLAAKLGSPENDFGRLGSVAVNNQNAVLFTDSKSQYIRKFDSNGNTIKIFGGANQFHLPTFVRTNMQSDIFVSDVFKEIQKFNSDGDFLTKIILHDDFGRQLIAPIDIVATDKAGNMYVIDANRSRLLKYDPNGKFLMKIETYELSSEKNRDILNVAVDGKGNIFLTKGDQAGNYFEGRILKFNPSGRLILELSSNWANGQVRHPMGIAVDNKGNIFVADLFNECVQQFDSTGRLLKKMNIPGPSEIALDKYGKLYCVTYIGLFVYATDQIPTFISGRIFSDENQNCVFENPDTPLAGVVVAAQPSDYYGVTDTRGMYQIPVDTGTYTVRQVLNSVNGKMLNPICPVNNISAIVKLKNNGDNVENIDFANTATLQSFLSTNVSSNRRRRCMNSKTTILYFNSGFAAAQNVKVYVKLPRQVILKTADKPYVIDKDSNYIFTIGTLKANESGTIQLTDSVACVRNITGLTACTKVWITPANSYTLPPGSPWDNSDLTLQGKCIENGRVRLVIKNMGQAMSDSAEFRILLDAQLALRKNYRLAKGDSLVFRVPANGKTIRLEADQRPGHPRKSQSNLTLEGCVASVNDVVSKGFVNALPQDDAEPEVAIDCQPIIDSFDPNDKQVSPIGTTAQHYTPTDSELKYLIRFQNTGTDTAYTVTVIDTLSDNLDIASLQVGAASHKYSFNVSGKGRPVLTWTFNNINLPDSTRNEPASNGFIQFSIKPKADFPEKTRIENFADIIFDYNDPIRTNTTVNVLYDVPPVIQTGIRLEVDAVLGNEPQWSRLISVYPNPSDGKLTIDLSGANVSVQEIEVRNSLGQKIVSRKVEKPQMKEKVDLAGAGSGLYVILLKTDRGTVTRKVVVR